MAIKKKSDCEIIRYQLETFYKRSTKIRYIKQMTYPSVNEKDYCLEIGYQTGKLNKDNYCLKVLSLIESERYSLLLEDNSMITWFYLFDSQGNLKHHTLMYLPFSEDVDFNQMSKYVRFDFDEQGKQEYFHSLVHTHFSFFDTEIRLPINHVVYPTEFIYIILKYIYHDDTGVSEKFLLESPKRVVLTNKEQKGLYLCFGKNAIE